MRITIRFLVSLTLLATIGCCLVDGEYGAYGIDKGYGGYEGGYDMHENRHGYYGGYDGYGKGYGGYGSGYGGGKGYGGKDHDMQNKALYVPYPMSTGPPLSALMAAYDSDRGTSDILWLIHN